MNGVTILNQTEISAFPSWTIYIYISIIIICAVTFGIAHDNTRKGALFGFCFGLIMGGFFSLITGGMFSVPTGEYQYKVTVDETVSIKEFNEKYRIISQEGNTYIVEERNNDYC